MALLKLDFDFQTEGFAKLLADMSDLNGQFLRYVGAKARRRLKNQYLSGQELDLRKFPKDSKGRNTITSDVNKKRTFTKIYSYPVNLFEKGRLLRSGQREQGKFIITKKLKNDVNRKMNTYAQFYERSIIENRLEDIGL